MIPFEMIVPHKLRDRASKVPLHQRNHSLETFFLDRPNESLPRTHSRSVCAARPRYDLLSEREVLERQRPMPAREDRQQAKAVDEPGQHAQG